MSPAFSVCNLNWNMMIPTILFLFLRSRLSTIYSLIARNFSGCIADSCFSSERWWRRVSTHYQEHVWFVRASCRTCVHNCWAPVIDKNSSLSRKRVCMLLKVAETLSCLVSLFPLIIFIVQTRRYVSEGPKCKNKTEICFSFTSSNHSENQMFIFLFWTIISSLEKITTFQSKTSLFENLSFFSVIK